MSLKRQIIRWMNPQLESTFLTALEQNQHKLLRICSVYSENEDDKKDLFQESLAHIWQAMPSFEGKSELSTWMFRITLNVCLRLHAQGVRKRNRFHKAEVVHINQLAQEDADPEDQELLQGLQNCIRKLNDADKIIITLYLEELPYREIATITGLSENHVAVKLKRIKSKLHNFITEKL